MKNTASVRSLVNAKGTTVREDAITVFQETFSGPVVRPADAAYDETRQVWNGTVDKRPGLIARCTGTAGVIAAVHFARENDLLTAIRGGGHNVGGRSLCDGGIVIDLSLMKAVFVDPAARTVRAQPGVTLGVLDRETHVHGLAVPVGVVTGTGIAGLTLGGGVGWLVRKYGLTIDNLLSCEVVTAGGEVLTANAEVNADLFWALRGGGGNFGVVTSFEYRAHPVHTVLAGMIVHPIAKAKELIRFFRGFMAAAPEELTAYAALFRLPDGTPAAAVIPCYCGGLDEGARVIRPLREFGNPMMDSVGPMPFPALQSMLDASYPNGRHNYWKSAMSPEFPDDAIEAVVESANKITSPLSTIVLEYYGGAYSRVGPTETAYAHRGDQWNTGIYAQWTGDSEAEPHIAWARGLAAALEPFSSRAKIISFIGDEDETAIHAAFGANYGRLADIKKKYDPTNFFRVNQNIAPAPQEGRKAARVMR